MKNTHLYLSLLFILTCAKEDSQSPNTPPSQIVKQYALTASAGEGGTVTGGGTFASGTQVSLTATPSSGYSFSGWSTGSTANPLTVTLNTNTTITANFQVIINSYTLTVSAGEGGSVSTEGGEYEEGTEVTISAIPNEGYEFTEWSDGSTDIERTITLTTNLTLESLYTPLGNPFISIIQPNYLNPSHLTRIPYLHRNYIEMYNTYGRGLVLDNYVGPPRDAVVIDYNGDGYYDLVHSGTDWENSFRAAIPDDDPLGNQHRNKIQFFYGNEIGELTLDAEMSNKFWGLLHGYKGNVNDYNNDGIPDMLFTGTGWHGPSINNSPPEYLNHEYPTMLLSNGVGNYEQINFFELSDHYDHSVSSGDYDNDGDVDVMFVKPGHRPQWVEEYGMSVGRILKNNGNGTFEIKELIETETYDGYQGFEISNQLVPLGITFNKFASELVDINNDGFLDWILGGSKNSGSHILLGNGIDFMSGIIELPGVTNYDFLFHSKMYDYDLDGDLDIIAYRIPDSESGSHYEGWYMQILKNEGGTFIDVSSTDINDNSYFGGSYYPPFIDIADFDNDGVIELFNNAIDRNSGYIPCSTCLNPKLEWELINGIFIRQ